MLSRWLNITDWRVDLSGEPGSPRDAHETKDLIEEISQKTHNATFNRISPLFTKWDFETVR
ncbi:MAG: hypothetical protein ACMUHX_00930 [bacterium]